MESNTNGEKPNPGLFCTCLFSHIFVFKGYWWNPAQMAKNKILVCSVNVSLAIFVFKDYWWNPAHVAKNQILVCCGIVSLAIFVFKVGKFSNFTSWNVSPAKLEANLGLRSLRNQNPICSNNCKYIYIFPPHREIRYVRDLVFFFLVSYNSSHVPKFYLCIPFVRILFFKCQKMFKELMHRFSRIISFSMA